MQLVLEINGDVSPERLEEYKRVLNQLIGYDANWTTVVTPDLIPGMTPRETQMAFAESVHDVSLGSLDYPPDAAKVRDMIAERMRDVDPDAGSESGGGMGCADLWLTVDGIEYAISVSATRSHTNNLS